MAISRKSDAPSGVTNASGEPEIVIELNGLVLSMKPPTSPTAASEPEAGADLSK